MALFLRLRLICVFPVDERDHMNYGTLHLVVMVTLHFLADYLYRIDCELATDNTSNNNHNNNNNNNNNNDNNNTDDQETTKNRCHTSRIKEDRILIRTEKPIRETTRTRRHQHHERRPSHTRSNVVRQEWLRQSTSH